jgi:hypothetical protein
MADLGHEIGVFSITDKRLITIPGAELRTFPSRWPMSPRKDGAPLTGDRPSWTRCAALGLAGPAGLAGKQGDQEMHGCP